MVMKVSLVIKSEEWAERGILGGGKNRRKTHGSKADLITIWDVQVWGDLLSDGSGYGQGLHNSKDQNAEKGDANMVNY